ncbi:MAG: hypothetical protein KTR35_10900 [Gammaproteobacteria bacterium]|nr:hypothetical protein [Gammaproteobacteria bacterium]
MATLLLLLPSSALAEYFGLANGFASHSTEQTSVGVELGYSEGDFISLSYRHVGVRVGVSLSSKWNLHADFGSTELGRSKGQAYGLGLLYRTAFRPFNGAPVALKLSYHRAQTSQTGFQDYEPDVVSMESIMGAYSGFLGFEPLGWYTTVGVHRFSDREGSVSELGVGGGLLSPLFSGDIYLGLDFIDELQWGFGYRHYVY